MIGGVPGNNSFPALPDSQNEVRARRAVPAAESGRQDENPARQPGKVPAQIFNAASIERRVEALNESEGGRLQVMDPERLPLRNQQALATFEAIASAYNDDEGELVGLDLRV